jgi:type II restriction enzyme
MSKQLCNEKFIQYLENKEYFSVALPVFKEKVDELITNNKSIGISEEDSIKKAYVQVLSSLTCILTNSQISVDTYIQGKIQSGRISDGAQARKSAAGNIYQQLVAYALAKNIEVGNLSNNLHITLSAKDLMDKYAAIKIGDDIQKPDADVILYSDNNQNSPITIISCKTSCRERAGQTYKWKLLCDLAICNCTFINNNQNCPITRLSISYTPQKQIKVYFVTADIHDELNQPQIYGMFNIFDGAYVSDASKTSHAKNLENIISDLLQIY